MNHVTLPWQEVRRRPLRTFLALFSVAIGIAAVISVRLASLRADHVFHQLQESIGGRFDLEITMAEGGRFDADQTSAVRNAPDVEAFTPLLHRTTVVYCKGKRVTTTALGFDPGDSTWRAELELTQGRLLDSTTEVTTAGDRQLDDEDQGLDGDESAGDPAPGDVDVLLESSFARMLGASVGDRVSLLMPRGPLRTRVVGIVGLRYGAAAGADGTVFLRLADLQEAARSPGQLDLVRLILRPNVSVESVRTELSRRLAPGLLVRVPLARTQLSGETVRGVRYALGFSQALALLMAVFITLNTFLMSVGERRVQWGIMRAIGTTSGQILRMLLGEAVLFGLLGAAAGLVLGLAAAGFLARALAALFESPPAEFEIEPLSVGLALLLGPALTMLACFLPARAAAKISPVEAMRGAEPGGGERFPLLVVAMASLCWLLATIVIVLSVTGWLPSTMSIPAGVLMMLGFVLMVPPILEPMSRGISRYALQWLWPAESAVASRQVFRNPRRATLATAVMIVALGDSIGMGHALVNTVADVRNWYQRALRADVILLPTDPQTAAELGLKAHAPVEDRLREIDGVEQIETLRMANVRVGDLPAMLVARNFSHGQPLPWSIPDADTDRVSAAFEEGAVVMGSVLAGNSGLAVGDRVRVEHAGQVASFPLAAIVTDYHAGGQTVYLRRENALAELGVDGVDLFLLRLNEPNRGKTEERLRTYCATAGLTLRSFQELRDFLEGIMSGVVVAFWCVLALGLVVASFGTINTLSMNVLEQTREIGLLRIIGMTRRQVRRTILSQTLILGLVAALLGTVAGLTTAYIIDLCMGGVLLGPILFQWRPAVILGCNALALLLLVPAALVPAWRATHINIWSAMEYE